MRIATPILFTSILGLAVAAPAATIHVPAEHVSIQAGVSAAQAGDTVVVAPGRYMEAIRMKPGVRLVSAAGPDSTVIKGADLGEDALSDRVLEIMEGDRSTVVEGFAFERGEIAGSAIYVENASPTIRGNVIKDFGWGINLRNSENALIEHNVIEECRTFGIMAYASSPQIWNNELSNNKPRAIAISGKESQPVIGGSEQHTNRIFANVLAIVNDSRNDIDATWNDWGWEVTAEMEASPYPADISVITDGNDEGKTRLGRGTVDYRHWISASSFTPDEPRRPRLWWAAPLAVILVSGYLMSVRKRG
ncbi:MAG: right-handed parallel beta-helix repeat-containing protein [Gemmatimonadetes bacterium]|nr:right-handed parallel beta-helix repeat-containing protein [Gemmatimonadota bacterium]